MLRFLLAIPAALLCCLALAAVPAPMPRGQDESSPAAGRGPRPGDANYDLFLRNGCASGFEGLWVIGRLSTESLVAELDNLLAQGPCPKAEQVLRRLAQSRQ